MHYTHKSLFNYIIMRRYFGSYASNNFDISSLTDKQKREIRYMLEGKQCPVCGRVLHRRKFRKTRDHYTAEVCRGCEK